MSISSHRMTADLITLALCGLGGCGRRVILVPMCSGVNEDAIVAVVVLLCPGECVSV